jgi:hypothetical protein
MVTMDGIGPEANFEFRLFEANSVERLIDIARASGSDVKIDTQQPLDPSKRGDEDRLRPRSLSQNNGVGYLVSHFWTMTSSCRISSNERTGFRIPTPQKHSRSRSRETYQKNAAVGQIDTVTSSVRITIHQQGAAWNSFSSQSG